MGEAATAGTELTRRLYESMWAAHPQGQAVAAEPLIDTTFGGSAASGGAVSGALAGPVGTRTLAGYGAEVLRIDPQGSSSPTVRPEAATSCSASAASTST
jgi:hypothetical protein